MDVLVHVRAQQRPPFATTAAVDGGLQQVEAGAKPSNLNHPSFPCSSSMIQRNWLRIFKLYFNGFIMGEIMYYYNRICK